jgi:hypothetical protein
MQPRPRAEMQEFRRKRESLAQLRDRHLLMVEEHGFGPDYNRDNLRKYFLTNWESSLWHVAKI